MNWGPSQFFSAAKLEERFLRRTEGEFLPGVPIILAGSPHSQLLLEWFCCCCWCCQSVGGWNWEKRRQLVIPTKRATWGSVEITFTLLLLKIKKLLFVREDDELCKISYYVYCAIWYQDSVWKAVIKGPKIAKNVAAKAKTNFSASVCCTFRKLGGKGR